MFLIIANNKKVLKIFVCRCNFTTFGFTYLHNYNSCFFFASSFSLTVFGAVLAQDLSTTPIQTGKMSTHVLF